MGIPLKADVLKEIDSHRIPISKLAMGHSPGPGRKKGWNEVLEGGQGRVWPHDLKGSGDPGIGNLVGGPIGNILPFVEDMA
jgi:hypothetical protein